jgi:hypothetical protein
MITAEAYTRKAYKNASEDFVRGVVWTVKKVVGEVVKNRHRPDIACQAIPH